MADALTQQVLDQIKTTLLGAAGVTGIVGADGAEITLPMAVPDSALPFIVIVPVREDDGMIESVHSKKYIKLQVRLALIEQAAKPENKAELFGTDVIDRLSELGKQVEKALEAEFPPDQSGSAFASLGVQNFDRTGAEWNYPEPGARTTCMKILEYEFEVRVSRADPSVV